MVPDAPSPFVEIPKTDWLSANAFAFAIYPRYAANIADAATGQPVEMSPRKWESSWRKFPISIWMQEQEGRSWFTIDGDSLRVAFECDERLRGPFERMSGELVDFRLAAHARPRL